MSTPITEMIEFQIVICHHCTIVAITSMYAASPEVRGVTMWSSAVAIDCVQLFSRIVKSSASPA